MRSSSGHDRLVYVIKVTSSVLEALGVPGYSSERSNKLYDEHGKMGLLVLKQYLDVSYRELCFEEYFGTPIPSSTIIVTLIMQPYFTPLEDDLLLRMLFPSWRTFLEWSSPPWEQNVRRS